MKNMKMETLAATQLIGRMMSNEATPEELKRAMLYMITAADCDVAMIKLYEVAERTGIKELVKKYTPKQTYYGVKPRSGRYPGINNIPKLEFDLSSLTVGDKITVDLKDFGEFEATVQEVTDKSVLFIFDDYITERPMNENSMNAGGYEESDLKKWIDNDLFDKFPVELKARLTDLTLPTVGQVFGWDDEWAREHFEPDGDEQLPLMKLRKNRVAYLNNEFEWGWLRNAMKKEYSTNFAAVYSNGHADYSHASFSYGVRPAFRLVKE